MKIQNMLKKTFIVFLNAKPFRILILCLRREESHFLSSHRKEKSVHHSPLFSFCKNHILFMLFGWGNKKFKICIFVAYYMHMIQKITILDLTFKCHQTLFQTAQSSSHVFTTENAQKTFFRKIKFNSSAMYVCKNTYIQWYTLWNMIKIFLMTCKKEWIDVAIMLKAVIGKLTSQNSKKLNGYRLNILLSKVVVPQKFANSWKFHKRWIVLFH